ncbi:hypothetical protein VaNZ11_012962 [Volvox africanus]|uniref:RRM domain-containing protein n=1 Tax=Volvox africanus TaxID=51714 RepID=A0ABQ5SFY2_9CHLO|nr:hypothetical protein VaNZ11_012962 [Volvox africanus]
MARIYIGNLPSGLREEEIEAEFVRFGRLRSVWVARKPPGFALHQLHIASSPAVYHLRPHATKRVRRQSHRRTPTCSQPRRHRQRSGYTCRTFIEMDDARDADDAVRALDGYKGWRVEISRNRGPPPGRGGFRGGPPVERFDDLRRSPPRRRSPSPYRRPSPLRRRSLSPRRRSLSPIRRRSPSPIRRRSPSPIHRRSLSPIRRRSPSPIPRRSLSPLRRSPSRRDSPLLDRRLRSLSPIRERSVSPLPRRSPLRERLQSPGFTDRSRSRSRSLVRD